MPEPFLTLDDAARVAGHARWLEIRLFEAVGAWSATEPDPAVKAMLASHGLHHAWHAEVWRDRVPRVAHLDAGELTVPAGPEAVALVDALAATGEPGQTIERVTTLARVVLPALLAAYRARLDAAHPLADGPTVRWLGHVVTDEEEALAETAKRLAELLAEGGKEAAERASTQEAALQAVIASSAATPAGPAGPGALTEVELIGLARGGPA